MPPVSGAQDHVNFPNVPVKNERGYEPSVSGYPAVPVNGGYTGGYNGEIAQQRAHALVAQRLQGQPNMPHPQHPGAQHHMQQQPHQQQHQQQRMMAQQQQRPQMQQRPPPNHVYPSQTDGAADALQDWKALQAARAAQGDQDRIAADEYMRARIDALASRQDSGLMMPLSKMPKGKKRKAAVRVLQAEDADRASSSAVPAPARFDGEDDDAKEHDSDAINSDLDDSEDDLANGDDSDDETMDYMLCTYDKVQRVKNKWKCTLKDGILTTNKKEFLFHKANGEFEW